MRSNRNGLTTFVSHSKTALMAFHLYLSLAISCLSPDFEQKPSLQFRQTPAEMLTSATTKLTYPKETQQRVYLIICAVITQQLWTRESVAAQERDSWCLVGSVVRREALRYFCNKHTRQRAVSNVEKRQEKRAQTHENRRQFSVLPSRCVSSKSFMRTRVFYPFAYLPLK